MMPVFLIRFAFQYQFELKYSSDELCIFPPEESRREDINLQQYTIRNYAYHYSDILHQQLTNDKNPKFLKLAAFEALIAIHSINNPKLKDSDIFKLKANAFE